ncbi:MAG: aminotransferase class I/II-fold pyridoxal phosphate-dependent enzyme [Muribaculaceae bacterium]|nr:aminotransferase class I/II-fold pyridoxal phosphate-dependent enzyme [Muribaculaceae bacterium]
MIYEDILDSLEREHRLRRIPHSQQGLDLISNDYMGLAARYRDFEEEFRIQRADMPNSASASRLLQRDQSVHTHLEKLLDHLYGKRTLLMNSGYHANTGALSALSIPGTLIVSDKLIHASMIDGIRLGHGETQRFAHNDMKALRKILDKKASQFKSVVVAVESVYSMDGDLAPLLELADIKRIYPNVILYVDEAHAFGVFGERGLGLAEELGLISEIDILIVTLGKAAAGFGAFIATSEILHSYLINCARSFIFSTALPHSVIAWNSLMIEKLLDMKEERRKLRELSGWFRHEVEAITGKEIQSRSQIIPIHAGSAEKAIAMAAALRSNGIDALPIRRPTVAAGTERLRLSLSADLTREDLIPVLEAIRQSMV